jgi:septum formation protein
LAGDYVFFKTADIDEKAIRTEKPEDLVVALAEAKANEIISKLGGESQFAKDPQPTLLITADTVCFDASTLFD